MNWVLRGFAAIIDLLQFLFFIVFLGLAAMTPIGGGVVGGAAGATICYNASGNVVSGAINAVYCAVAGAGIGAFAIPVGIVVDISISCTFGLLLIIALAITGRFSFFPAMFAFVGEMTPGVNAFVPAWSILVHRSIRAYEKKEGTKATARSTSSFLFASGASTALGVPSLGGVANQIAGQRFANMAKTAGEKSAQPNRPSLITKSFDGIRRPQNSNSKTYAATA